MMKHRPNYELPVFGMTHRDRFYHLTVLDQFELRKRLVLIEKRLNELPTRKMMQYELDILESARHAVLKYLLERQTLEYDPN